MYSYNSIIRFIDSTISNTIGSGEEISFSLNTNVAPRNIEEVKLISNLFYISSNSSIQIDLLQHEISYIHALSFQSDKSVEIEVNKNTLPEYIIKGSYGLIDSYIANISVVIPTSYQIEIRNTDLINQCKLKLFVVGV
jgi:hypothetical protein